MRNRFVYVLDPVAAFAVRQFASAADDMTETGREIGQISGDFTTEEVVKNDLVDAANDFDAAKVKADADGYELNDDYEAVDVEAIKGRI